MMRVIQTGIAIAVAWANIYFGWTPNGYVVGLMIFGALMVLTVMPFHIYDAVRYKLLPLLRRDRRRKRVLRSPAVLQEPVFPAASLDRRIGRESRPGSRFPR